MKLPTCTDHLILHNHNLPKIYFVEFFHEGERETILEVFLFSHITQEWNLFQEDKIQSIYKSPETMIIDH